MGVRFAIKQSTGGSGSLGLAQSESVQYEIER
jgi:hypothetical protein